MQLSDGEAQLGEALKKLDERWITTAAEWQDSSRTDFEKEHLDELRRACKAAQRGMFNVNDLLKRVIRDCT